MFTAGTCVVGTHFRTKILDKTYSIWKVSSQKMFFKKQEKERKTKTKTAAKLSKVGPQLRIKITFPCFKFVRNYYNQRTNLRHPTPLTTAYFYLHSQNEKKKKRQKRKRKLYRVLLHQAVLTKSATQLKLRYMI